MQNAQNLMSSFEFIAALMSIIVGLGVTNLLAGAGRAFYRRKENPLDEVHIVLTLATLLLLVLQWWVTFKWNTELVWIGRDALRKTGSPLAKFIRDADERRN